MIKFEPNVLYPLDELETLLKGHVELPTFLQRLGLKQNRVFRDAVWGWEILERAREAPPFSSLTNQDAPNAQARFDAKAFSAPRKRGAHYRLSARDLDE